MRPVETGLSGTKILTAEDDVQLERRYTVWPTSPAFDEWEPALDILATVLGEGKSSRLHRRLVHESEIARDVAAFSHSQELSGEFLLQVTTAKDQDTERVAEVVEKEVESIKMTPPSEAEMNRAKNQIATYFVQSLERTGGFGGRADQLNYFNVLAGDPGLISTYPDTYESVTAEQVSAAANRFLCERRVELTVSPRRKGK